MASLIASLFTPSRSSQTPADADATTDSGKTNGSQHRADAVEDQVTSQLEEEEKEADKDEHEHENEVENDAAQPARRSRRETSKAATTLSTSNRLARSQGDAPDLDSEYFDFDKLRSYRWTDDSIEIEVAWTDGSSSWEPESNLHRDALATLLKYWEDQGGRPENPQDEGLYDIFALLKQDKKKRKFLVEWVGFPKTEATWESEKKVKEAAPEAVEEFRAKQASKR